MRVPDNLPLRRLAGVLWLLAGVVYLASETIAAAAFRGYRYADNYISDLGVPYPHMVGVRMLQSPLAWVMNAGGFILDGVLFAAAAIIASLGAPRAGGAFLALALIHSAGSILVGSVHSGPREMASGANAFHVLGAAMAIAGGNLALLFAGGMARRLGLPEIHTTIGRALGGFGLVALALLEANRLGGTALLGDGVFERASVYPITAWEIMTGLLLVARSPRSQRPAGADPPA